METGLMGDKKTKQPFKITKRKVMVASLITFILLMLALTAQLSFMTLKYDKIYKGIFVNDINAGGLSTDQLKSELQKKYEDKIKSTSLLLKAAKYSETIEYSDIEVKYDISGAVDHAYSIGRSGSVFDKFYDIFISAKNKVYLELNFSYNEDKLKAMIDLLHSKTLLNVKNSDLNIKDTEITILSGHHGENIEKNKVLSDIQANIKYCTGGLIPISIIETSPSKINVDDFYSQIQRAVADATVAIVDNEAIFTPEVIGRSIDKGELESITNELEKSENTEKILPVTFIQPKLTLTGLKAQLFKDELYSFSSSFKTRTVNEKNRSINIRLEIAKINGTIIAPGGIFSYNNTVGKKTIEQGYKEAFTYVAGKQIPGLGGGICQVSSTLYNAVLYADLEVVQRRNHMFQVSYVPFGQDATIYYGSTDFQFKNSTNWPLLVNCRVTPDNKVVFSLVGTNENLGKSVKVTSKPLGAPVPFTTRYIDDPTATKEIIEQTGHNGGTYQTFKTVYQDGKIISSKKITTSVYKPLEQVVKRPPPIVVDSDTIIIPAIDAESIDKPVDPDVLP
jgi:vancomycin resistance protein YoaR